MKKVLALILMVSCLFALSSCGLAEEDALRTAEEFMDAYVAFDKELLEDYVDDPDKLPENMREFIGYEDLIKNEMKDAQESIKGYEDDINDLCDILFDKIKAVTEYEIVDTEKTDQGYVFTVEITSFKGDVEETIESELLKAVDEESLQKIVTELMQEGKITASSTQEDILALVMPVAFQSMEDALDKLKMETDVIKTFELLVYKTDDGEVLVNAKKSDFDA